MMQKILILTSPNNQYAKDLQKSLSPRYDIQSLEIAHRREFPHELLGTEHFALIITFDLVGFEQTTLMDGILYNLVSSKFLNFMLRKNLANEKFLSRQLSISMFFYCRGPGFDIEEDTVRAVGELLLLQRCFLQVQITFRYFYYTRNSVE